MTKSYGNVGYNIVIHLNVVIDACLKGRKTMDLIESIYYGDYTAKINLSRGANCFSIRKNDFKILREPDYSSELDNPYLYGMPILFPVNRISEGVFEFEGRKYIFDINEPETNCHLHGKLHTSEFKVIYKTDNKIVCSYRPSSDDPYVQVGHDYSVEIEYALYEDGFHQYVTVENLSNKNMPVMLGFHTTFNTLFANGINDEIFVYADISEEYERNMKTYLPTGKILEFDDVSVSLEKGCFKPFDGYISRHYKASPNGKMIIYDRNNNLSIIYENDEKYQFRLIFNRGEYICLEPQNCMADCANSMFDRVQTGFDYIQPNKKKKYISKIYIHDGDARKKVQQ